VTRKQALSRARHRLVARHITDAPLESELLMRHALNLDRVQLYLELDREMTRQQEQAFTELIARRCRGEPTAYITGHKEFYGIDFYVDHRVLIPRPESELLVDRALALAGQQKLFTIADIGTGCGAIASSLALNLATVAIYATDVSAAALEVARYNCQQHQVAGRIHLLHGNLLQPLPQPVDLIIANLPYVRRTELPPPVEAASEPRLALDGGGDGLEKIRQLCYQLEGKLNPGGQLLLEIGHGQPAAITGLITRLFPGVTTAVMPDLSGTDRVVQVNF